MQPSLSTVWPFDAKQFWRHSGGIWPIAHDFGYGLASAFDTPATKLMRGFRHAHIKPNSPQLNGKVERSHRSGEQELYQLLTYKDDVSLEAKLEEWERFCNFARTHGAFNGRIP